MNKNYQKKYWERKQIEKRRKPNHPVIKAYVTRKIKEIEKCIPINKNTTLLDVGCGNGFFTFYFDQICKTYGIDYSKKMIQSNPVKNTKVMNANNLEFKDNSFKISFCHAVLHHTENPEKILQEMKRVSKKYIVVIEPNRNNPLMFLFSLLVAEERKALRFSLNYLTNLLKKQNLKILSSFSHGLLAPNKTPTFLLKLIKKIDFKWSLGMYNIIIAEK